MTTFPQRPRPSDLPDFADPPVDEVVIGIEFMTVGGFSSNHIAKYRDSVKQDFPGLQYQPRLLIQLERLTDDPFSAQAPFGVGSLVVGGQLVPPGQRTWLVSGDEQRVIQIQDDAFLSNWRRRDQPYPRFETLVSDFWHRFWTFRDQVAADVPLPLQLQQLEVTYVNWVPFSTAPVHEWFGPASRSEVSVAGHNRIPEHHNWAASFLVDRDGVPVARLHARQQEALRPGPRAPELGATLELHFRAPLPPGATDEEINDLAHEGRTTIVWAFTRLTTEEGHKRWGLKK